MTQLGSFQNEEGERDAVHVSFIVLKVECGLVEPGEKVRIDTERNTCGKADGEDWQGVVDPFLPCDAGSGDTVAVFIRPELVGKLKHTFDFENYERDSCDYRDC